MHANLVEPETGLSRVYFTKEFPGYEVESKWTLFTQNPVPTLLRIRSDLMDNKWPNFLATTAMGKLPVGMRFFDLIFQFWGVDRGLGLEQVAMVACMPDGRQQLAFKSPNQRPLSTTRTIFNPPLVRLESRKGDWISGTSVTEEIRRVVPQASLIGEMRRQKCFMYIASTDTFRNFSISTDLCYCGNRSLSQLEVEYKGRRGCWLPDSTGDEIAQDFSEIHMILMRLYGEIISPTNQTKFKWITGS